MYKSSSFTQITCYLISHVIVFARHFRKPTALSQPLSPSSAHAPNIHINWPLQQVRRFAGASATTASMKRTVDDFSAWLSNFVPTHPALPHVLTSRDALVPGNVKTSRPRVANAATTKAHTWLVLPYFPPYRGVGLGPFLAHFNVRISWKLSAPHWCRCLCKASRHQKAGTDLDKTIWRGLRAEDGG